MGRGQRDEGDEVLEVLMSWVKARMQSEKGATMVEYGLLIVLIALVAALGAYALGLGLDQLFSDIAACLNFGAPTC